MKGKKNLSGVSMILLGLMLLFGKEASGQLDPDSLNLMTGKDSLISPGQLDSMALAESGNIIFTLDQAVDYLSGWYSTTRRWKNSKDQLRVAMGRLLYEATHDPLYNSEDFIRNYDWEVAKIPASSFFLWDSVRIFIPDRHRDTVRVAKPFDADFEHPDSLVSISDLALVRREQQRDSIVLVIRDTLKAVISSNPDFPFRYYDYPGTGDSIQVALNLLLDHVSVNDSSMVIFQSSTSQVPVMLRKGTDYPSRIWLRNEWGEEVSVWVSSISPDTVRIFVEDGVHFRRLDRATTIADAKIETRNIDNSKLAEIKTIEYKPDYWKFYAESAFIFNQALLKNWVKGGESNISTTLDITGTADYTNKQKQLSWNTQGRFRYGILVSGDNGPRKNVDQIDLASKFNFKAFGKFNFSATMLFKTQLARGYTYPDNEPLLVSKFFNPAMITLGLGLDYKPNKNTSINFAPLSYKGTFVPDTSRIDPTKHGLAPNQRSRNEPGMSAQLENKSTLFKNIEVINRLRLFTNYIDHPQNIDVDWEMILTAKLNWFTELRLNTQLIYDDNTLIPLLDDNGDPVIGGDGNPRKVPMVQFKEIVGISMIFRF